MRTSIALALSASCLIGGVAFADGSSFTQFDRDKNGRVIAGEISAQGDVEIIAAMDANKDGAVTPDEWQTEGRGSSYVEKGGIDQSGVTRRWLEFKIVYFEFKDGVVATSSLEGQAQLALDAGAAQIEVLRQSLDAHFVAPTEHYPRVVASY